MAKRLHQRISLLREKREIPSGQDRPILPAQVANQNTEFASSCPLAEPAIWQVILFVLNCPTSPSFLGSMLLKSFAFILYFEKFLLQT